MIIDSNNDLANNTRYDSSVLCFVYNTRMKSDEMELCI